MPNVEAVAIVADKALNGREGTPFQDNTATGDSCAPAVPLMPVNAAYQRNSQSGEG
jgi:hypothetical protein